METQNNELTLKEFEGNSENQIMVLNPYEDEGVIYEISEPTNENLVPSVDFDENLQQPCEYLCHKQYEDNHSYVSPYYSFSEFLFQE